jgi:acyl-CoA synthetase (AMP-forming)/AMP-acid ligase II
LVRDVIKRSWQVTLGGEKVPRELVKSWVESVQLVNVYGTTEGTVYQTSHTFSSGGSNPACIGRPLPGTAVAVVRVMPREQTDGAGDGDGGGGGGEQQPGEGDEDQGLQQLPLPPPPPPPPPLQLAGCGEVGELLTGGMQTADGYHGERLARESARRFLPLSGARTFVLRASSWALCGRFDWYLPVHDACAWA